MSRTRLELPQFHYHEHTHHLVNVDKLQIWASYLPCLILHVRCDRVYFNNCHLPVACYQGRWWPATFWDSETKLDGTETQNTQH